MGVARFASCGRVIVVGTSLGALMGMVMAALKPERIAGVVLNDAGPAIDPAGLRRIAGYAGKLPPVSNWTEAAAQAKSVYGIALPALTDAEWLDYARCGYRENAAGVPVPDMDPKISEAFKNPPPPRETCGRCLNRSTACRCWSSAEPSPIC